jgi:hypothetical protein
MGKKTNNVKMNKSDVKKYMYKNTCKNKEIFWKNVVEKRNERTNNKKYNMMDKYTKIQYRYLNKIDIAKKEKIQNIIMDGIGNPKNCQINFLVGDPQKSKYTHSTNKYMQYNHKYTTLIHHFDVYITNKLTIDMPKIEGLYNVYCKKLREIGDITMYKATWLNRHRGYNFSFKSGYVAVSNDSIISYHAATIKDAIKGIKRKIKKQKTNININSNEYITLKRFIEITGACNEGCKAFLYKHNIIAKKIKVPELIKLLEQKNQLLYANKLKKAIVNNN